MQGKETQHFGVSVNIFRATLPRRTIATGSGMPTTLDRHQAHQDVALSIC